MIGIIGAGISGLSLAYHLQKKNIPYILLEASPRVGGYIQSIQEGNYLLELGPNSLLVDTATESFLEEIGLLSEMLPANEVSKHRYIFRRGKYRKLPSHPFKFLLNNFFSLSTKWAVYREMNRAAQYVEQESLADFFKRRFSQEIVDYALNPFVSGIYAGDPDQLLIEKTFPKLLEYERQYGSVIRGFIKNKSGERKKSVSFQKGMEQLPQGIAQHLKSLALNMPVLKVEAQGSGYLLHTPQDARYVDSVVIACSAPASSKFLAENFTEWSDQLKKINYPPLAVVHTAYPKAQVRHPLDGFGGLNPKKEQQFTAGSIWTSSIFEGRCPSDEVLFTSFVGGSLSMPHTQKPSPEIKKLVHVELQSAYQIQGAPRFQHIFQWEKAIPQYDLSALDAQQTAESLENHQIYVCANWLGGVSLADAIRKGKELSEKLAQTQTQVK